VKALLAKVRECIKSNLAVPTEVLIRKLNPMLRPTTISTLPPSGPSTEWMIKCIGHSGDGPKEDTQTSPPSGKEESTSPWQAQTGGLQSASERQPESRQHSESIRRSVPGFIVHQGARECQSLRPNRHGVFPEAPLFSLAHSLKGPQGPSERDNISFGLNAALPPQEVG